MDDGIIGRRGNKGGINWELLDDWRGQRSLVIGGGRIICDQSYRWSSEPHFHMCGPIHGIGGRDELRCATSDPSMYKVSWPAH